MLFQLLSLLLSTDDSVFKAIYILAVLFVCTVLPFMIGRFLATRFRMQDYGWKIGLILMTVFLSSEIVGRTWDAETGKFNVRLGVDLKGGVILIYEVEEGVAVATETGFAPAPDEDGETPFQMSALVEALSRRINPSGTKEIVIRPYGDRQVEIIIPEVDQREVDQIKKTISTAGVLQFRIVANRRDHADIITLAEEMAKDPVKKRSRRIFDENKDAVGYWARVAREQIEGDGLRPFKLDATGFTLRDASSGDLIDIPPSEIRARSGDDRRRELAQYVEENLGLKEIDILMSTDDGYDVNGSHLGTVNRGFDEVLTPCIHFNLKGRGVGLFSDLTGEYSPEGQFTRQLGIVLDNELLSAPNIQERITGRGRITGQFTQPEVDFLVNILQAGSLPVVLNKVPISENLINPLLGKETIQQGRVAIIVSLSVVLVFILIYYRFAGVVACIALLANLLFIFALMVTIKAALTLPGLAGLVLTVGMSVDANVLIFERIREEMRRGSALRMAIRNGFGRATTTIVDANVTTLITALVLYAIGTDQIRGFAVTLILGILMSMFTAIFCSRVIFDIAERTRRLTSLNMMQLLSATQIDFISKRHIAGVFSLLLIVLGIVGIVGRGADIFDIDFRGGTSVHLMLKEASDTEQVRDILEKKFGGKVQYTLTGMSNTPGRSSNTIFKVDSGFEQVEELEAQIKEAFQENGGAIQLATYSLNSGPLRTVEVEATPDTPPADEKPEEKPAEKTAPADTETAPPEADETEASDEAEDAKPSEKPAPADGAALEVASGTLLAYADEVPMLLAQAETTETPAADTDEEESSPAAEAATPPAEVASDEEMETLQDTAEKSDAEPADTSDASAEETTPPPPATRPSSYVEVKLNFGYGINADTLRAEIEDAAKELDIPLADPELLNPDWQGGSNAFNEWTLRIAADEQQTQAIIDFLKQKFSDTPVWPSSSKIGSAVAGRMQNKATMALLTSLLGIVVYIWIRFQKVVFGLAAVVALVHDVLITLGAIALSYWLAGVFGFLLIEEFKISLPIVAALLTIIGYSLNDTIVVFDRIREVRGKSPKLTGDMINRSINQTLGRTLLTSLTTLIVVAILYAIGGEGIHGFAFALVIGVIVGTYSSIFVASPALLWMSGGSHPSKEKLGKT